MASNVIEFTIKGIDKASGPLGAVSKTAGSVIKVAAGMAAAVAGTAGAVVAFTSTINSAIDKQAKFALRIGETTANVQALQFAAELGGVGMEQFNAASLRVTKGVAEAARGMGEARTEIARLGLDARELSALPLDQKMGQLADALNGIKDPAERARIGMKLFGNEGSAMLQVMSGGSEALRRAANDARFLGITMSEQGAANAQAFNDAMTRAQSALKGVSMGIAADLTPALTGMANQFANFVAEARPAIVGFATDTIRGAVTIGNVLGQVFSRIKEFISKVFTKEGFQEFVDAARMAIGWTVDLFVKAGPILGASLIAVFRLVWETFSELGKWGFQKLFDFISGKDLAGTLADVMFDRIPAATAETREMVSQMWADIGAVAIDKGTEASNALIDVFGINVDLARQQADEMIRSIEEFGAVAAEVNETVSAQQMTFMQAFYDANAQFMSTQQEMVVELANMTYDVMMQTIDAISQGVAQTVVEGGNLMDALSQIGKQVLTQMVAMLVKMGIQRMITGAISNAATASQASAELAKGAAATYVNAFASTAAIPIVGPFMAPGVAAASTAAALAGASAAGASGSALGPAIAGARADGGPVNMGQTYLVGERGPELFTARTNGNIVPNEALGGGGGVTIGSLVIHVLENATNADMLLRMSPTDMREVVAAKIIPALDSLARQGTRPQYLMG